METRIALRYSGPAVDSGLMDVYEASANMIAFSQFVVVAAKAAFGQTTEARAEVAGFGKGSFVTDLVFNVGGPSATLFTAISPEHLWLFVKEAFALWKHLKGAPPSHVEDNSQWAQVTNNSGQVLQVRTESLTIVLSEKGGEAVSQFVKKALERPGMDSVAIASATEEIGNVTQDEAKYFGSVTPSENITDVVVRMALVIEAPVFKDGNKWRFSDGQQSFYADIEDAEFLAKVNAGERFGKGDVLYADVRINQEQTGMKITASRTIVKVHDHKIASTQLSFH
jgi:hypothetical protein